MLDEIVNAQNLSEILSHKFYCRFAGEKLRFLFSDFFFMLTYKN